MPQSQGPHLCRLKAKRGSHDLQWAFGVSFWGRTLTIHLSAGEGITCLLSRISAGMYGLLLCLDAWYLPP